MLRVDEMSRIIITSEELKDMHNKMVNVMTKVQARKNTSETSSDVRIDHLKIGVILKKCNQMWSFLFY